MSLLLLLTGCLPVVEMIIRCMYSDADETNWYRVLKENKLVVSHVPVLPVLVWGMWIHVSVLCICAACGGGVESAL